MNYLFDKYPQYLSLDVSTDNTKAVNFYKRIGLWISDIYLSEDKVEFAKFETPSNFKELREQLSGITVYQTKNESEILKECLKEQISIKKQESDDETIDSEKAESN